MVRKYKKIILDVLFLALVIGLTFYGVFKDQDPSLLLAHLETADLGILLAPGILIILVYICMEAVIFKYLFSNIGVYVKTGRACLYSFIGFFFSLVTPAAMGGQPMQLYAMMKDKHSFGECTPVLLLVTVTFKLVLVIAGLLVLIFRPAKVMEALEPAMFWVWLGIVLNTLIVAGMLLLIFKPKTTHRLLWRGLHFINRIHSLKKLEKYEKKIDDTMNRFGSVAEYYYHNQRVVLVALLITFVQRFLLFFITNLVYWSFHLSGSSAIDIILLQCMISVATEILPIPGGTGVFEWMFLSIFGGVFGTSLTLPAMVLSRGLSYYVQLLISALMTIVAFMIIGKKRNALYEE